MINDEQEWLIYRNFPKGLLLAPPAAFGQDAEMQGNTAERSTLREFARELKGVYADRGNLRHIGAVENFLNTTRQPVYIKPFYVRVESAIDADREVRGYLVARLSSTPGVYEWVFLDTDEGTTTTLDIAHPRFYDNCAVVYGDRIFYTEGNGGLSVMYRDKTHSSAGVPLLNFANDWPVPADGGAGDLNNAGYPDYYYLAVLVDVWGNRSNPTQVSPQGITVEDKQIELTFSGDGSYISSDIDDVDFIELYRVGGRNSEFRLAKRFKPALSGNDIVDDATGNPVIDNTIDEQLPDIFPSEDRDIPPSGFNTLAVHQSRIYAAGFPQDDTQIEQLGSPSRLWFSRKNEPEAWGYSDDGVDNDGGYIDIDNASDDAILAMESMGSILLVGRAKSLYAFYGDGFTSSRFDRRAPVGIASRRAFARDGNTVYFFGNDRRLYRVGDEDNDLLITPIEGVLDSVTDDQLRDCVCWCHDSRIYISIPLAGSAVLCYCYQIDEGFGGGWINLSYAEFRVHYACSLNPHDSASTDEPFGQNNLMVLCKTGETQVKKITEGVAYNWTIDIVTMDYRPGFFEKARVLQGFVEGSLTNAGNSLSLSFVTSNTTKTYSFGGAGSAYTGFYSRRLPPQLTGEWVRQRITGTLALGSIDRFGFSLLRLRPAVTRHD